VAIGVLKGPRVRMMLRASTAFSCALRSPATHVGRLQALLRVPALSTNYGCADGRRSLEVSPNRGHYEPSRITDGVCRERENAHRGRGDRESHEKGGSYLGVWLQILVLVYYTVVYK